MLACAGGLNVQVFSLCNAEIGAKVVEHVVATLADKVKAGSLKLPGMEVPACPNFGLELPPVPTLQVSSEEIQV